jgi:dihydrofolate reductase
MSKLRVFNLVTLNGYFAGPGGDLSWHQANDEFHDFAKDKATGGATLLFGRLTYELMARHWPSPEAIKNDPVVAGGMNRSSKVVFSRTLQQAEWSNTRLVKDDLVEEVLRLKKLDGPGLTILGSGSIVVQLTQAGLIDEVDLLVNPIIIGSGKTLFEGLRGRPVLNLVSTRTFRNGSVLLSYAR